MILSIQPAQASPAPAAEWVNSLPNPHDVINGVNAVRASHGLPPYQINGALMAAAQAHSEYQASIGSTSHTGQGGSSIAARAIAAGYGGGAAVSVTENVWGGGGGSAQAAVNWWQNDGTHLATLISTRHQDVGAGVASKDGSSYYTLMVGAVTGAPGSAETQIAWSNQATGQPSGGGGAVTGGVTGETTAGGAAVTAAPVYNALVVSTPGADGSLVHVVQDGETIWSIAAAYKVGVADVLLINGLNANSSVIVPGQKIIIQPPGSLPTATFALSNSEGTPVGDAADVTEEPTRTPRPTATESSEEDLSAALVVGGVATDEIQQAAPTNVAVRRAEPSGRKIDPVLLVIGGMMAAGVVLLLAGSLLKRGG